MAGNRSNFGQDTGLQARMVFTMFLLGLLYVVFIGVLFAAGAGAGLIVVVAVVLLLLQLFASDKIGMATLGVKEVTPAEEPELHGDHRAPVRAGRSAQAAGLRDGDLDAQRLRDGPLAEDHDGLRDPGILTSSRPPSSKGSWRTS